MFHMGKLLKDLLAEYVVASSFCSLVWWWLGENCLGRFYIKFLFIAARWWSRILWWIIGRVHTLVCGVSGQWCGESLLVLGHFCTMYKVQWKEKTAEYRLWSFWSVAWWGLLSCVFDWAPSSLEVVNPYTLHTTITLLCCNPFHFARPGMMLKLYKINVTLVIIMPSSQQVGHI